jgi:hypothetical protein
VSPQSTEEQARERLIGAVTTLNTRVRGVLATMHDHVAEDAAAMRGQAKRLSLAGFEHFVHALYAAEELPVLGMGFLPNPDLLPEFSVRWWYNSATPVDSPLRALNAGNQPQAMDYYDTLSTDWWQNAAKTSESVVSGPFVDISGTNAYVITFTQAVRVDDEMIGVVAADVTVGTLQALCQNILLDLPRPTSIVNADGMVIATNAGALLGSAIEMASVPDDRRIPVPGTPWMLVNG